MQKKGNVFVKPNEQCRACSDIVMARIGNRRHGALSEVERQNALLRNEKEHFLSAYDAPMTFQIHFCLTIINHLPSSTTCYLAHLSTSEVVKIVNSPLVNASTKPLVNSSTCQVIHLNFVRFSVRILTL